MECIWSQIRWDISLRLIIFYWWSCMTFYWNLLINTAIQYRRQGLFINDVITGAETKMTKIPERAASPSKTKKNRVNLPMFVVLRCSLYPLICTIWWTSYIIIWWSSYHHTTEKTQNVLYFWQAEGSRKSNMSWA